MIAIKQYIFLLISISILNGCLSQDSFCDKTSETDLKIPILPIDGRFQATVEKNVDAETEEIIEIYDGLTNIGIVTYYLGSIKTRMYSYANINELLVISGDNCLVYPLNISYSLTPFQVVTINGTQHIISPLNALISNPALQFKFLGSGNSIRGIPVNEWQLCVNSPLIQKTVKITVSFSDDKKWSPAVLIPGLSSVPIQISVQYKADNETVPKTELYSVLKFRTFNSIPEEEYFTPKGIYCPGRKNLKNITGIPSSFAFSSQVVAPFPNSYDRIGTVETLYEEYNLDNKLFRYIYSSANTISNEIHDYVTGLKYIFERKSGRCNILPLDPSSIDTNKNGSYLYLRDPNQFFDLDNSNYQYVGMKRVDGVNTDVWVGLRNYNGINSTIEWHFLSGFWNLSDTGNLGNKFPIPIQTIMFVPIPLQDTPNKYLIEEIKYNIFGFSKIPFIARDYDISTCDENAPKRQFIFKLGNDLSHLIRSNVYEFQRAVLSVLAEQIKVTILRVSKLQVVFDIDGVYVLFTLLEKAKTYGPVPTPSNDLPLDKAVEALKEAVLKDKIQIQFRSYDDNDVYDVPIIRESLTEIGDYTEGFVIISKQNSENKFSNTAVAVVTIIAVVIGVTLGLFLTVLHKSEKIKLPLL